jgi:hypothetical protein|tara:strand:+ start:267 stop:413 length:147 start_codon:yes stop_codon:yes gene_type:complete
MHRVIWFCVAYYMDTGFELFDANRTVITHDRKCFVEIRDQKIEWVVLV